MWRRRCRRRSAPRWRPARGAMAAYEAVTLLGFPASESGGIAAFVRALLAALEAAHGTSFPLVAPTPEEIRQGCWPRTALRLFRTPLVARAPPIHNHETLPLLAVALLVKALLPHRVRVVHTVHVDPAERK